MNNVDNRKEALDAVTEANHHISNPDGVYYHMARAVVHALLEVADELKKLRIGKP